MEFPSSMWCGAASLLLTIVLSTKILRVLTARRRTIHPLPPLVNGIALLALLPALVKKGFPAVLNDLYVKYGSVFMASPFGLNVTVLIGPEVTAHFFQGLESEISHGNMFEFTVGMFGKEVGYARDSATRIELKRFYVEALKSVRLLSSHVSPMLQEVESYFDKWGKEGIVDLKFEFAQLLMLISSRCLLGKEVRENKFGEISTLFHELETGLNLIGFLYPYLPTPANRQRDRARIRITEILSDVVESRKKVGRVEKDTLQILIDSKYKDGRSTTTAEVVGIVMAMVFAGKHTSCHTCTWTGACLLSNPTLLKVATEEQEQISKKYKDGGLDYNAMSEMVTLHNCIKEVLRMHPPVPVLVRKAHKNFTVQTREGRQYEIPKEHIVATPVLLNNNIPYIYKDPHVFDPHRFHPERKEDKVGGKFSYTSFGGGFYICNGEAYAYMQIKMIWSHLLRNFQFELISPFPKTDWSQYVAGPKGNLFVRYKRTG